MPPDMKLVIYETTHHEILPSILDLAGKYFSEIAVFLKRVSFDNLSGQGAPSTIWPSARFYVQEEDMANRLFIKKAFGFLRKNRYSHLHISTLDNNLLPFALHCLFVPKVHISLTVHEINEYSRLKTGDFRDMTESLAKAILWKRIRHYRFLLPAMAKYFRGRFPSLIAVYIPSRFYSYGGPFEKKSEQRFTIVIPGSVDPNRKDYDAVAGMIKRLLSACPNEKAIELVLLGDSDTEYGKRIIEELRTIASGRFTLVSYPGYVPQHEYEKQLAGADILWSPLKIIKRGIRQSPEVYGQSTASGLIGDLLLYPNPVLVPAELGIPEGFTVSLLSYSNPDEWLTQILHLIDRPSHLPAWREEIHRSLAALSGESFEGAFETLMGIEKAGQSA